VPDGRAGGAPSSPSLAPAHAVVDCSSPSSLGGRGAILTQPARRSSLRGYLPPPSACRHLPLCPPLPLPTLPSTAASHSALHCRFPLCPPLTLPTPAASRLFWRSWGRYPPRNRRRQREGCGSVCRPSAACAVSSTNTKVISPTCQPLSAACTAKSKPRVHCIARSAARCRACLAGVLVARL